MERETVLKKVLDFLAERFPGEHSLSESTRLAESVVIDSLATLEVVMFLESEFGLALEREDLDSLDTPSRITDLILSKSATSQS